MARQVKVRVDCGLEIKAVGDDGFIEGLGAVFGNVDLGFDKLTRGAFESTLRKTKTVPMLWQHADFEPIGVWDNLKETRDGLHVTGQLNLETQKGREARALAKQGAISGLSIGYIPRDFEYEDDVRVLKRVDLLEVSLVTFPMNPEARVSSLKNMTRKQLEVTLREELGLSRDLASRCGYALNNILSDEEDSSARGSRTSTDEIKSIRQLTEIFKNGS